jgi:DNA-binding transcriptional LysR family regulator
MDWNDLKYLMALSHQHTLPAAAEALGVNRTTVSRRIEQLESDLGVRLVEKVGRDLTLTAAGKDAVASAEQIDGELQNLERSVFGRDQALSGVIRLTATQGIACLLAPYLVEFQNDYPDVRLDISVTNAKEDLELMESDIALRITNSPPESLIGRVVASPMTATYASRSIAARWQTMDELDFVSSVVSDSYPGVDVGKSLKNVMYTNSMDLIKELVAAGKGVSRIPCYLAEGDQRLVRIGGAHKDPMAEIWLLYHPRLRSQLRIRRFVEYLVKAFEQLRPIIEANADTPTVPDASLITPNAQ